MATIEQLQTALVNADKAGDTEAATTLAATLSQAMKDPANLIPDSPVTGTVATAQPTSATDKAIGAGEAALSAGTGVTTGALGMIGGTLKGLAEQILNGSYGTPQAAQAVEDAAGQGAQALTYQPSTQSGQDQTAAIGNFMQNVAGALPPSMTELRPAAAGITAGAGAAQDIAPTVSAAAQATAADLAKTPLAKAVQSGVQKVQDIASSGAPDTKVDNSLSAAQTSPEAQRAAVNAGLPVPFSLTKGALSRDAPQLAFEKEQIKGPAGAPLRERAEENNIQALGNFDQLVDMTNAQQPDIAAAGNSVTKALSLGYEAAKEKTRAAYAKAQQSPGASEPVDLSKVVSTGGDTPINSSLLDYLDNNSGDLTAPGVPTAAKKGAIKLGIARIDENGNLVPAMSAPDGSGKLTTPQATVSKMESLRQLVNNEIGADPKDIRQGTIIKKLIDNTVGDAGGPDYQAARQTRIDQANKYENRGIVARLVQNVRGMDDPKVYADQVLNHSILNAAPEEIQFLKKVLTTSGSDGQQAWRELQGATVRHIQDQATKGVGTDSVGNPLVSPAQVNKTVNALDKNGRLDLIFGKKTGSTIRDLNDMIKDVNTVPPGTLVNHSGTAGTIMAAIAEAGATGALTGLPVPAVSLIRAAVKHVKNKQLQARVTDALNIKEATK